MFDSDRNQAVSYLKRIIRMGFYFFIYDTSDQRKDLLSLS